MPNDLFWSLTSVEIEAFLEEKAKQIRAEDLRAGLVAATLENIHRKKGARAVRPSDFIRDTSPRSYMSPEEGAKFMDQWAAAQNKKFARAEETKKKALPPPKGEDTE